MPWLLVFSLLGPREAWAQPGRSALAGFGCPSPCGARRGLQLRGGVSLLEWERPAGQGGPRAYQRPERGGPRVKSPPEPPSPGPVRLRVRFHLRAEAASPRAPPPQVLAAAGSFGGGRRRCSPRPVGLTG